MFLQVSQLRDREEEWAGERSVEEKRAKSEERGDDRGRVSPRSLNICYTQKHLAQYAYIPDVEDIQNSVWNTE